MDLSEQRRNALDFDAFKKATGLISRICVERRRLVGARLMMLKDSSFVVPFFQVIIGGFSKPW